MEKPLGNRILFVYYKLASDQAPAWAEQVRDFCLRAQALWPGLQVELMQRPEPSVQGVETWMEVYRHPTGMSDDMMVAIEQLAQEMGLPGPRANEVFVPLRHQPKR